MTLWRPKRSPLLSYGRAVHLVVGALVPCIAWWIGGYEALGWATVGTLIAACGWEMITPALAGPMGWVHRYGDVIDLAAFAAGVVLAALIVGRP